MWLRSFYWCVWPMTTMHPSELPHHLNLYRCGHIWELPWLKDVFMQHCGSLQSGCCFLAPVTEFMCIMNSVESCLPEYFYILLLPTESLSACETECLLMHSCAVVLHTLKSHSWNGRCKALSTWVSHISLFTLFLVSWIFACLPQTMTISINEPTSLFYTNSYLIFFILHPQKCRGKHCCEEVLSQKMTSDGK